jgi:serine/threonine protein kinase
VKVLRADISELLLEHELLDDLKKARNEQRQQLENEAALLSTLRHPNVVNFLGFAVNGNDVSSRDPSCQIVPGSLYKF